MKLEAARDIDDPDAPLWRGSPRILQILAKHVLSLDYGDVPDYDYFINTIANIEV